MRLVGHIEVMTDAATAAAAAKAGVTAAADARAAAAIAAVGAGSAPGLYGVLDAPLTSSGAASAAVGDAWASMLRQGLGLPPPPATPAQGTAPLPPQFTASSSSGGGGFPIVTPDQAQASRALALANLAAVEATVAAMPPTFRTQALLALAEAKQRVAEADAAVQLTAALHGASQQQQAAAPPPPPPPPPPSSSGRAEAALPPPQTPLLALEPPPPTPAAPKAALPPAVAAPATAAAAPAPRATPAAPASTIEERRVQYSLRREAERKRRARGGLLDGLEPALAFPHSQIVSPDDAIALYSVLPFGGDEAGSGGAVVPPSTRLIFSSYGSSPATIAAFAEAYTAPGAQRDPTVVLIRANGHVFGGFAADPWDFSELYGGTRAPFPFAHLAAVCAISPPRPVPPPVAGSPRSFLFSITRDCKLPYHGRVKGPRQLNDDVLRQAHEVHQAMEMQRFHAFVAQQEAPQFDEQGRLLLLRSEDGGQTVQQVHAGGGEGGRERVPTGGAIACASPHAPAALLQVVLAPPRPRPFVRHDALRSSLDLLQFGLRDLLLAGDLSEGSSEVEVSYGMGLRAGSTDAHILLAGAPTFKPEAVEIWAVSGSAAAGLLPTSQGGTAPAASGSAAGSSSSSGVVGGAASPSPVVAASGPTSSGSSGASPSSHPYQTFDEQH